MEQSDTIQKKKVLIADRDGSETAAEIPYLLKKAGCEVTVLCRPNSWLLKNKNWDHHITSPQEPEAFAELLMSVARTGDYDWIIPGDDNTIRVANQFVTDDTVARKILPISKMENRLMLGSKAGLSLICEKLGVSTPKFVIFDHTQPLEELTRDLTFPLLTKIDQSAGGGGITFCSNIHKLKEALDRLPPEDKENLTIQEYITGESIGAEVLYKNGHMLACAISNILKNVTGEFSVSLEREYFDSEHTRDFLRHMGEMIGINGFSSITLLRDKAGALYLVEADLRPQVWFYASKFAGVDFSAAIRNYLSKDAPHALFTQPTEKTFIKNFSRSLFVIAKDNDARELLRWIFNIGGRWKFIPFHDHRLLAITLRNGFNTYLYFLYNRPFVRPVRWVYRKIKYL